MQATPEELNKLTAKYFPEPLQKALIECLFLARKRGCDLSYAEYARPEAKNVVGLIIRGKLEGLLRSTADRFGIESEPVKHPGQPWYHTELRNGPLVLTAATVPTPGAMVEPSDYRVGLAESSQLQFDLPKTKNSSNQIYLILIHSKSYWPPEKEPYYRHLPGSAYLVYPAADLKAYVHDVNLFDKYPDIVKKHTPVEWTDEALLKYLLTARRSAFSS